jgi:hypothetical protein
MRKRQNPDLELLRMGALLLPLIAIGYIHMLIRKEDTAIKMREAENHYPSHVNLLPVGRGPVVPENGYYRQPGGNGLDSPAFTK